ncbi:hypothetical protein RJ639_024545 [Escallonia herrerae]|uniref:Two-component response regulator n=1 Tax=Escallonia herrerae TaxID=1293975 RepID=A0AA88V0D1_9ASTE|nr:hypothetical protein RJ639_024545 [Escallonia herrerae]
MDELHSSSGKKHLIESNGEILLANHDIEEGIGASTVTVAERATTALLILLERKDDIHVVIVDNDMPDLDVLNLLRLAANMELLAILMSAKVDDRMISRAIESGAFRTMEKPVTEEALKYLWQHVMREMMMRKNDKFGDGDARLAEISTVLESHKLNDQSKGKQLEDDKGSEANNKANNGASTRKLRCRKSCKKDEKSRSINNDKGGRLKRKACTEWTDELHSKFMVAVRQLGEGRCYPKEILELMKVPGLTRMQVASHLQKCRNDNWRAPEERKFHPPCVATSSNRQQQINPRKFGTMPRLLKKPNNAPVHLHEGPEIYLSSEMDQHMNPHSYLVPEEYSNQSVEQKFANMEQLGAYEMLKSAPFIDKISSSVGDTYYATRGSVGTLEDMAYYRHFDPILPDFSNANLGKASHVGSSSQRQSVTEIFGSHSELNDLAQNYAFLPEGPSFLKA